MALYERDRTRKFVDLASDTADANCLRNKRLRTTSAPTPRVLYDMNQTPLARRPKCRAAAFSFFATAAASSRSYQMYQSLVTSPATVVSPASGVKLDRDGAPLLQEAREYRKYFNYFFITFLNAKFDDLFPQEPLRFPYEV